MHKHICQHLPKHSAIDDLLVYDSMNTTGGSSSSASSDDEDEEDEEYDDEMTSSSSSLDEQGTIVDIKDMDIWDASFDPGDFFGLDFLRYLREYFDKHASESGLTFASFGTWVRGIHHSNTHHTRYAL